MTSRVTIAAPSKVVPSKIPVPSKKLVPKAASDLTQASTKLKLDTSTTTIIQKPKPQFPNAAPNNSVNTSINSLNTSYADVSTPGGPLVKSVEDKRYKAIASATAVVVNKENIANGAKKPAPDTKVKGYSELKKSEELLLLENKKYVDIIKCIEAERDHAIQQARIDQANYKSTLLDKDHETEALHTDISTLKQQLVDLDHDWRVKYEECERIYKERADADMTAYSTQLHALQTDLEERNNKIKRLENLLIECAVDPVSLTPFDWRGRLLEDPVIIDKQLQDDIDGMEKLAQELEDVESQVMVDMLRFRADWETTVSNRNDILNTTAQQESAMGSACEWDNSFGSSDDRLSEPATLPHTDTEMDWFVNELTNEELGAIRSNTNNIKYSFENEHFDFEQPPSI